MKLSVRLLAVCLFFTASLFAEDPFLAGTGNGLYRINKNGAALLWNHADVRKIIRTDSVWYFLTGEGIYSSTNLSLFEERNNGLPVKVIKIPQNGTKNFTREIQELKDLEVHPDNPLILVTATKDAIYLTRDGGASWKSLGLSAVTAGVKAVTVLDLPDSAGKMQLTVMMSHPIYGVFWIQPDKPNTGWGELNAGLEQVPSIKWPDEVADISAVKRNGSVEVFASQTFMPRIYRLDWANRQFTRIWSGTAHLDTIEGLSVTDHSIVFTSPSGICEVSVPTTVISAPGKKMMYKASLSTAAQLPAEQLGGLDTELNTIPGSILSAWVPADRSNGRGNLSLSELWLLSTDHPSSPYSQNAIMKKGNYIPILQIATPTGYDAHLKTLKANKLNMLVVDMKDDIGTIRYNTKDPLILAKGRIGRGIDVEPFVAKAKENGIYLVARIVVFKDKSLATWGGSRYAIWDKTQNKPWQGYMNITQKVQSVPGSAIPSIPQNLLNLGVGEIPSTTEGTQQPQAEQPKTIHKNIEEYWVDPYSEEVWEYNVEIAKELIARGFDEIQFDYIRFPTDGANLSNASYRWQDPGMDKESALMSFLSYARREIKAPISIDIYGANGWYRTGARTGQDVELLSRYVDVICPMFYPSHFEQVFLAQSPAQERPYRIYYYGSYRNAIIARNHVIVRPWAQAFYLNVSYDRAWYNPDYVQRQIFGMRDSINQGYTYWNNSGRYADLRPDVDITTPYPWQSPESVFGKKWPVFGGE